MNKHKKIGAALLSLPLLIIAGFLINYPELWLAIDAIVFIVAGTAGIVLFKEENK
jgi:hypothetical protein